MTLTVQNKFRNGTDIYFATTGPWHSFLAMVSALGNSSRMLGLHAWNQRHASTSTPTSSSSISLSSPHQSSISLTLNPPSSTLPPPLTPPTRQPDQSTPGYYFSLGKAYLSFYKTGLKAIYTNYNLSRPLSSRSLPVSSVSALPASPTPSSSSQSLISSTPLTRAEWQLVRRSREDLKKIPLFALVFAICGEFTPLVVLFLGAGVVPRPCRIPRQIEGERKKAEDRRKASFREGTLGGEEGNGNEKGSVANDLAASLSPAQAVHAGRSLGLYGGIWDRVGGFPQALLRRRIARWEEYITLDDALLREGGGAKVLAEEEVRVSCEERGLDVLGRDEKVVRERLQWWLNKGKEKEKGLGLRDMVVRRIGV